MNRLPRTLESERLQLRVAMPGDGKLLNEAVIESLADLEPWMPFVRPAPTVEQSEEACREAWARWQRDEDLMMLLFLQATGELVGSSGLHSIDWSLGHFEVGYWSRSGHTGQGLVTEAVRTLADFALGSLHANRVYLQTDARNLRSSRVAELAGFELEGTLRNERRDVHGQLRDTKVYSRVPERPHEAGMTVTIDP